MQALELLWLQKVTFRRDIEEQRRNQAVALAIIELHLSKGID